MNIKNVFYAAVLLFSSCATPPSVEQLDCTQYVNPFIGTQGEGHCFPGATVPMGMVQLSPESYTAYYHQYENARVAGYQYDDPYVMGFTHTHLNGTGCPSLADILFMPYCGKEVKGEQRSNFKSAYDKKTEIAAPGYYHVYLKENKVDVSLTATPHTGVHAYTFDAPKSARLLVDLQYGVRWDVKSICDNVLEATQEFQDEYTLVGYRKAREWTERKLFYVIKFSHPILSKKALVAPDGKTEKAPRYVLSFDMQGDKTLEVRTALSTTSIEGAKKNLRAELPSGATFESIRSKAKQQWNTILSKIQVEMPADKKVAFYTSLYHLYIQPNNLADVDGKYRSENDSIYTARSGVFHSTFSLWDTYRAAHPLYTILTPNKVSDMAASLLASYEHKSVDKTNPEEANPYLPRWGLWGREVHTMIGNHAVTVLADARLKGIRPSHYTDEELYEAVKTTVSKPHYRNHIAMIDKYGYIPLDAQASSIDDHRETVSRLLEGTLNEYALAQLAQLMHKDSDYNYYAKRQENYKNAFDPATGFMCARYASGKFRKIKDYSLVEGEWVPLSAYTEGNPWHYLFHVQQDIPGLMRLMGGETAFRKKLDAMFYADEHPKFTDTYIATGCMGQYWHGNEPCHHVPYLYKYTKEGYKTDAIIRYLTDNFYKNAPDGLQGNDDCGQMSAWYVFSCLGFYPVNPCDGGYVLGAPQVKHAKLQLPNGKTLTILAENFSTENKFVKAVFLNGKPFDKLKISHKELMMGGELRFVMTPDGDDFIGELKIN